jgi:hypothetical protein
MHVRGYMRTAQGSRPRCLHDSSLDYLSDLRSPCPSQSCEKWDRQAVCIHSSTTQESDDSPYGPLRRSQSNSTELD